MEYVVLNKFLYERNLKGISICSGCEGEVIGEELIEFEDKDTPVEVYIYNIIGYEPKNGKPFIARKENIKIF